MRPNSGGTAKSQKKQRKIKRYTDQNNQRMPKIMLRRGSLAHDRLKCDHALAFFTEGDSRFRRAQVSAPQTIAL
jgi:hypothetical protein